jgi:probable rRNA maturation factor
MASRRHSALRCEVRADVAQAPPPRRVRRLLDRASRATRRAGEVSVLFCGDRRMRSLNRRYRKIDRPTDVLAFPAAAPGLLGDIVVSLPYAGRQARRRAEPVGREIDRLLLHGFLHLAGYDHETDSGEMDALEARLRRRFGIAERT